MEKKEEEPPAAKVEDVKMEDKTDEKPAEPADKALANKSAAAALKAQLMGGAATDDSKDATHSAKKQKTVSCLFSVRTHI